MRSSGVCRYFASDCRITHHTWLNWLNWLTAIEPNCAWMALYTSSIGTPSSIALSRSTSARSCGVVERNVVCRPASSGRPAAFRMTSCVSSSSRAGSPAVVSCTQNSKPPVVPMPGIGGGGAGNTVAPSIDCASR